mgnify:CR=1 FL=1
MSQHALLEALAPLRAHKGVRRTVGLDDATVLTFAATHPDLVEVIEAAAAEHALHHATHFGVLLDQRVHLGDGRA